MMQMKLRVNELQIHYRRHERHPTAQELAKMMKVAQLRPILVGAPGALLVGPGVVKLMDEASALSL
jgi:hypothetical protein